MHMMKRQQPTLIMENSDIWYITKPLSKKRIVFALLYYFIGHLFVMPLFFMVVLGIFYDMETASLYAQAISDTCNLFVFLILFLPYLEESFEIFKSNIQYTLLHSFKWYFPMLLSNSLVTVVIMYFTGLSQSVNQETISSMFDRSILAIAVPSILVAPLVEELIFRGIIFKGFRKFGFLPAALVSSLSFGFLHVMLSLITKNYTDLVFVMIYAVMAFYFCVAYEKTKNFFGCYVLHLLNNTLAMIAMGVIGLIIA